MHNEGKNVMDGNMTYAGGYYRCNMADYQLDFIGDKLCDMLGYERQELEAFTEGIYTCFMHPEDVQSYEKFLKSFEHNEKCDTLAYRLIKKDGEIIQVVDTMATRFDETGRLIGYAVICDVTETVETLSRHKAQNEKSKPHFAILKTANGLNLDIVQKNDFAALLDNTNQGEQMNLLDYVAINDRIKVKDAARKAFEEEFSDRIQCTFVDGSGKSTSTVVWIERVHYDDSIDDCRFCVIIEKKAEFDRNENELLNLNLLKYLTEDVYEVNFSNNTITCINARKRSIFRTPLNVRMNLDDAFTEFLAMLKPESRTTIIRLFEEKRSNTLQKHTDEVSRQSIEIQNEDGKWVNLMTTFVIEDGNKAFLCFDSNRSGVRTEEVSREIEVRLFGNFSVSVDGKPMRFRNAKSKELLALLIQKRGSFLSSNEAIQALWEEKANDTNRARYRKTVSRLISELKEKNIDYIIDSERGQRRIIPDYLICDYYDYLDGKSEFKESLLSEYSWSEFLGIY